MRTLPFLGAMLALAMMSVPALAQARLKKSVPVPEPLPSRAGSSMPLHLEPKLEEAFENNGMWLWGDLVAVPGVSFVKAHFEEVNLRAGDVLTLRTSKGRVVEEITGRGPKDRGTFWALSAFGEELELEFRFQAPYAKAPFKIDQVILGDAALLQDTQTPESICSPEDYDDVICYQSDNGKWDTILASVGVMTVGGNPVTALFCSGSNVSPLNYVLTNQHCVTTQGACDNTEFVFKFYRTACNSGAPITTDWQGFRCDDVVATKPFISCDQGLSDLDYALCSVIGDPAATFGFVTPDPERLTDGEAIYIVQHPNGRPHEIAHGSGADVDVDGTVLRYYDTLDTEGGSSGSPIFRESDHKLVGLHHCGGCSTPGTGNRGMLMADIYPEIQSFLCTTALSITADLPVELEQVAGDGDSILEPGETWRFRPRVRNGACDTMALAVQGEIQVNPASTGLVTMLESSVSFGDIASGSTKTASTSVRFKVLRTSTCGSEVIFDLVNLQAGNGGPFPDASALLTKSVGEAPVSTRLYDDFAAAPGGWSIVDGGTGSGAAVTWTTADPGLRSLPMSAPYYIADSDELGPGQTMDETLISPVVDCSGLTSVQLQFTHDFNWYSGGQDEQADVDVRSSLTGGAWVNVAKFQDADTSGTVTIDLSAQAAGQSDLQIRFHYYDAVFEFWWAVDDVYVLGSAGFECDVFQSLWEPVDAPGARPGRLRPPQPK